MTDPKALEELDLASRAIERARALLAWAGPVRNAIILECAEIVDKTLENGVPRDRWDDVDRAIDSAREDILAALSAALSFPSPAVRDGRDERDEFEAWAAKDNRRLEGEEFEERVPDNNLYYQDDTTNHAYVGWCAARAVRDVTLREKLAALRSTSDSMADDEGLWFQAQTCAEAYVQRALRILCDAIERDSPLSPPEGGKP